ncbi:hypothetical protein ACHAPT_013638 [Fusarium lateritium]
MGTATVNRKDWSISEIQLDKQTRKVETQPPLLHMLQDEWEIAYPALYDTPGLGGHLAKAVFILGAEMSEIHFLAKAITWLEAAMREAVYDIAPGNHSEDMNSEVMVEGNDEQLYTMTFVPWILLTGLLALGTASLMAIGLTLDFLRTPSLRNGRMLSPVRLMMDVSAVLDKHVFEQALTWDGDELDAWVKTVELRYEPEEGYGEADVMNHGDHGFSMRLRQMPRVKPED